MAFISTCNNSNDCMYCIIGYVDVILISKRYCAQRKCSNQKQCMNADGYILWMASLCYLSCCVLVILYAAAVFSDCMYPGVSEGVATET